DFEVAIILFWLAVGFIVREQFSTARFEWDVITGKRQRRWPQFFYLAVKIAWWAYVATNVLVVYTPHKIDCQASMYTIEALMGIITLCSSVLLACRTICVYQDRARIVVITIVTLLACGLAAAWGQGVMSVSAIWIPGGGKPWTEGGCAFTAVSMDYSVKYIITMVFDFVVLMLTVYGVIRLEGSDTKIGYTLIRQGIFYFVVTFVVNALITGFTIAQLNPVMSLILAIPTSAIAITASTRLYMELAEETRPMKDREVTFSRENEESYFGTVSGMSTDSRKRKFSLFRRTSSMDPEKLPHVLSLGPMPSSPLVEIHAPTPSHSGEGSRLVMVQQQQQGSITEAHGETITEHVAEAPSRAASVRMPRSSSEVNASGGTTPHRIHRKQPSLSVLPSAAAAAANLRIEESQTVTTEPMPVHLLGYSFRPQSRPQEEAVLNAYASLSRSGQNSSHGHGQSSHGHSEQ
ncbi:hypothetical protein OC861_006734, partial [Tilletia horrida]